MATPNQIVAAQRIAKLVGPSAALQRIQFDCSISEANAILLAILTDHPSVASAFRGCDVTGVCTPTTQQGE